MDWNVGQTVREVFRLNERMERVLHGHCVDPGLVVLDNEHHHPLTHLCRTKRVSLEYLDQGLE